VTGAIRSAKLKVFINEAITRLLKNMAILFSSEKLIVSFPVLLQFQYTAVSTAIKHSTRYVMISMTETHSAL